MSVTLAFALSAGFGDAGCAADAVDAAAAAAVDMTGAPAAVVVMTVAAAVVVVGAVVVALEPALEGDAPPLEGAAAVADGLVDGGVELAVDGAVVVVAVDVGTEVGAAVVDAEGSPGASRDCWTTVRCCCCSRCRRVVTPGTREGRHCNHSKLVLARVGVVIN